MKEPTIAAPHFHVGQRVLCVDASKNPRCNVKLLSRGRIYIVRGIDVRPGWKEPGWGVHLQGIRIVHPDVACEWAMNPKRFRPVTERPTDIEIFRKLLKPARPVQLQLPLPKPHIM